VELEFEPSNEKTLILISSQFRVLVFYSLVTFPPRREIGSPNGIGKDLILYKFLFGGQL
jgi:hypothetical protein